MNPFKLSDKERQTLERTPLLAPFGGGDDLQCWELYMYGFLHEPTIKSNGRLYRMTKKGIDAITPEKKDIT